MGLDRWEPSHKIKLPGLLVAPDMGLGCETAMLDAGGLRSTTAASQNAGARIVERMECVLPEALPFATPKESLDYPVCSEVYGVMNVRCSR